VDTYNLAAFNVASPPVQILQYGFGELPKVTFGAAKVIARVTQLLLTLKGSDRTDPYAGCYLLNLVGSFHTSERAFLMGEIDSILEDITAQMLFENDPRVSPEGQFRSINCTDVIIDEDIVSIYLDVWVASNLLIAFALPVSVNQNVH